MEKSYLDLHLPKYLEESISEFNAGLRKMEEDKNYLHFDCDYCQLQANINCAESDNEISSEQAWYLRGKYLGLSRGENGAFYA